MAIPPYGRRSHSSAHSYPREKGERGKSPVTVYKSDQCLLLLREEGGRLVGRRWVISSSTEGRITSLLYMRGLVTGPNSTKQQSPCPTKVCLTSSALQNQCLWPLKREPVAKWRKKAQRLLVKAQRAQEFSEKQRVPGPGKFIGHVTEHALEIFGLPDFSSFLRRA